MKSELFEINGKNINYYQNKEKGNPIFFIHGNSAGGEAFVEQLNSPFLNNYRCIALDLPACALSFKSQTPEIDYSVLNLTDILMQFIEHFNCEAYTIVAHSLGGHLVLESLEKLKGLNKLILFGTPPLGNTGTAISPFLNNSCIPLLFKRNIDENERKLLIENFISSDCKYVELIEKLLIVSDGQLREQLSIEVASGQLKDEVAEFKNLMCKKFILHGQNDSVINLDYIELLKDFCSDKLIHVIKNAGHYPQLENPSDFNEILGELIRN